MRKYGETELRTILQSMENELLALIVVDLKNDRFDAIFSGNGFWPLEQVQQEYDFFTAWQSMGLLYVLESDRERMSKEIKKDYLTQKTASGKTFITTCSLIVDGMPLVCRVRVERNLIEENTLTISIRDIDGYVHQDQQRVSEMKELLHRESIYRNAILANAAGYMEVNLSKNQIISGIYDKRDAVMAQELSISELGNPVKYDEFEKWWSDHMLLSDTKEFLAFSNCAHLISCYENRESIVSIECVAKTAQGKISLNRETYYLSQDQVTGDIMAICVLYDLTKQQNQEREMEKLREELKQMRMKNFISQMNPHFLYNALGSIREIVLENPEYGADMLYDFTTHLRASIRALGNDDFIPFSRELENIRAYVNIEKMRFQDKLTVEYDIGTMDFEIVPLCIQPLVENAIGHGIYEKNTDDGKIIIRTRETDADWQIDVEDNGTGFDPYEVEREVRAGKRDSTGLLNLIFRLENMMNATVEINSIVGEGTKVRILIPKSQKT